MKLTERLKKQREEAQLPVTDARATVVREAFNFGAQVERLAAENEDMAAKIERLEREIERLCSKGNYVTGERDYWRKMALHWIGEANKLTATIDGHLSFVQNIACTMQEAKLMAEQILPPTNGVDTVSHMPLPANTIAPEPTLEECQPVQ